MSSNDRSYLPTSATCFVCGHDNPRGLKLRFFVEDGRVQTVFTPDAEHCGYPNVLHGGLVATLLDETMGWAANRASERMTLTGEMTVRYVKPVPGNQTLHVWAEIIKAHRRLCYTRGGIQSADGELFARAEGRFLPVSLNETVLVDDHLVYQDKDERIFDAARAEKEGK